ncbi:MAG: DUF6273 domain-containing protein [Clostridia bacterium]|nr:DUF6273 domain-containing protein [Clostridia bacterium]
MAESKSKKTRRRQQLRLEQKRRRVRRILCVLLAVCAALAPIAAFAGIYIDAGGIGGENVLKRIRLGSYPQTLVTDPELLGELSALPLDWTYYDDCYSGSDFYGTQRRTDCMKYADTELGGEKYRAVMIERYRPRDSVAPATADESLQDDNGFSAGKVFFFLFEPITWLVYDYGSGFSLTEKVLDAASFNNSIYWTDRNFDGAVDYEKELSGSEWLFTPANLYKTSSVRKWLNSVFFETAFSPEEKKSVALSFHRAATAAGQSDRYNLLSLYLDRVFLPSLRDVSEPGNFWEGYYTSHGDEVRLAPVTDYARCRGAATEEIDGSLYSWEWLCTPGDYYADVMSVNIDERVISVDRQFSYSYTVGGIRCAARVKNAGAYPGVTEEADGK